MSQVERALELALEALVQVEYIPQFNDFSTDWECPWCKGDRDIARHLEDCARHAAIVAIHEARVEMNTQEASLWRDIEKGMSGV